jgi:HSP20 family molecular chaperone IbpA
VRVQLNKGEKMNNKIYRKIKNTNRNIEIINNSLRELRKSMYCFRLPPASYFKFKSLFNIDYDDEIITLTGNLDDYKKEDIKLRVENKNIYLCAQKVQPDGTKYFLEVSEYLPSEIDVSKSKATYIDGFLTITMPRVEKPESETTIKVE